MASPLLLITSVRTIISLETCKWRPNLHWPWAAVGWCNKTQLQEQWTVTSARDIRFSASHWLWCAVYVVQCFKQRHLNKTVSDTHLCNCGCGGGVTGGDINQSCRVLYAKHTKQNTGPLPFVWRYKGDHQELPSTNKQLQVWGSLSVVDCWLHSLLNICYWLIHYTVFPLSMNQTYLLLLHRTVIWELITKLL